MPIKKSSASDVFQRKISDFCDMRLKPLLQPRSFENIKGFMIGLIVFQSRPPFGQDVSTSRKLPRSAAWTRR